MGKHEPEDANGKDLKVGDWVRVIAAPSDIGNMLAESKDAFSRAVGETLQIEAFDEIGCMELDLYPKLGSYETIWLEPYLCKRFRRYKKLSKSLQATIDLNRKLDEKNST